MSATAEQSVERGAMVREYRTIADLASLPEELPSGPSAWELWDGEIRLMAPMGDVHGSVQGRITTLWTLHGEWEGHGRVTGGDVGVVIQPAEPQTCFGADVAFLTTEQLPVERSPEGYLVTVPALIAEVRSKNDSLPQLERKAARYLEAGAKVVWVADERRRTVTVYRGGEEPRTLGEDDELTAEGIIPGFSHPVRRLFENL